MLPYFIHFKHAFYVFCWRCRNISNQVTDQTFWVMQMLIWRNNHSKLGFFVLHRCLSLSLKAILKHFEHYLPKNITFCLKISLVNATKSAVLWKTKSLALWAVGIYLSNLHLFRNGAFVIAIQGKDVTNNNTKELIDLMKREREMCHLLVRPRRKPKHEILSLNLDNQTNGTLDKTTLHVFMRIKESSSAFNCGFKDFDEILQVRWYFVVFERTCLQYDFRISEKTASLKSVHYWTD